MVTGVWAAHCLSEKIPWKLNQQYQGFPLPDGELAVKYTLLYDMQRAWIEKIKTDLIKIGVWDPSAASARSC